LLKYFPTKSPYSSNSSSVKEAFSSSLTSEKAALRSALEVPFFAIA